MNKININKEKKEISEKENKINLNKKKKSKFVFLPSILMFFYMIFIIWTCENLAGRFVIAEFIFVFFFVGVILIKYKIKKSGVFLTVISGLLIVMVLGFPYISQNLQDFILRFVLPKIFVLPFILIGFCVGVLPIINRSKQKKRCTVSIESIITKVKTNKDEDGTTYCPVYSFTYNGKRREYCSNVYDNIEKYIVGDDKILYINPDDDNDIYIEKGIKSKLFQIVFGIVFLGFGIYAFFLF